MQTKLKIDIVSDIVCPWCTVGYKRLAKAIEDLGVDDQIEIEWQPFELNPNMPLEGQNLFEHLSEKYGSNIEQLKQSQQVLIDAGKELDFTFDFFDEMKMANTFQAHILLNYAKDFGKQTALKMYLTKAFFSDRKDVSDRTILKEALEAVGLNTAEALARLDDDDAKNAVIKQKALWLNSGINAVPTFVFNRKSMISGAQQVDTFKQVLNDLLTEQES